MTKTGWAGIAAGVALLAAGSALAQGNLYAVPPVALGSVGKTNDFPTVARAEYVMACMSGAPQQYEYLMKCSCAIDTMAGHLTYEQFVDAQTIRSMQQSHNRNAIDVYGNLDINKKPLDRFYLAEAYAELKCF
jgi:hypothetical protein